MRESPPKPPRLRRPREPREMRGIDIILTKSISRFVRNTVDLLTSVRELKILGVAVRFERVNIDTRTAQGELLLTLLTSFAQAESDPQSGRAGAGASGTHNREEPDDGALDCGQMLMRAPPVCFPSSLGLEADHDFQRAVRIRANQQAQMARNRGRHYGRRAATKRTRRPWWIPTPTGMA